MPELTRKQCKKIQENIKRSIEAFFPGYVIKRVVVLSNGEWEIFADSKRSLPDFYHLYPGLTKTQADYQIVRDVEAIVKRYLPDAFLTDFDQYIDGEIHCVELEY